MMPGEIDQFFRSTRGRIILYLMRSEHTVNELAELLGITDNAVRAHMVALERDGVIRQSGERRSGGRPAYIYDVTAEADQLFPKAYDVGLLQLVRTLAGRVEREELHGLLAEAGRSAVRRSRAKSLEARVERALEILEEHGGVPSAEADERGRIEIRSACCILSGVVEEHRACCHFTRGMVEGVVGSEAEVRCEYGERPCCCFRVEAPAED